MASAPTRGRGRVSPGCLVSVLLLGVVVYVAAAFAVPYAQYWRFKETMEEQAVAAQRRTDAEIRQLLAESAARLEVPLEVRDIGILRTQRAIQIWADWTREVALPKYRHTLHFQPAVQATLTPEPQ